MSAMCSPVRLIPSDPMATRGVPGLALHLKTVSFHVSPLDGADMLDGEPRFAQIISTRKTVPETKGSCELGANTLLVTLYLIYAMFHYDVDLIMIDTPVFNNIMCA